MNLRRNIARLVTLIAMICFGTIVAIADTPLNGSTYRVKNARGGFYLCLGSSGFYSSTSALANSEDLWEVGLSGSSITLKNVSNSKYIGSPSSNQNDAAVGSSTSAVSYTLATGTYNGTSCYQMKYGDGTYSLNMSPQGEKFVIYTAGDNGAWFIFEKAETVDRSTVEVVQLRNVQYNTYYLYEDNGTAKTNTSSSGDQYKWILYPVTGSTFYIINKSTGHFMQAPTSSGVTCGTTPVEFTREQSGSNYLYKAGGQNVYLNRSGSFMRYTYSIVGNSSNGSQAQWTHTGTQTMTEQEVDDFLGNNQMYARTPLPGTYYRINNALHEAKYMVENYLSKTAGGAEKSTGDYTQMWRLVEASGGRYYLQNALTGDYLIRNSTQYGQWTTQQGQSGATQYTIAEHSAVSTSIRKYFTIVSSDNATAHLQSNGWSIVPWAASNSLSASDWLFENVSDSELAGLSAAQNEFAANSDLASSTNNANFMALFADEACTAMAAGITASNLPSNSHYQALPQKLKDIAMKVASNSWAAYERTFRIADYHVYSDHSAMRSVIRVSNDFGRLSNPTGISASAGEIIFVFVGNMASIPSNATLRLELVKTRRDGLNATGQQIELHSGINAIVAPEDVQAYIYYEIVGATNNSNYYLSHFPTLPIHIEGGHVNGYFDLTRNMTNADWTGMLAAGLFSDERLQLKGRHVLYNWPSSEVKANNPSDIIDLINYWDDLCRVEAELLGLYRYDATETEKYYPGENLLQRFNNVFNATGGEVGGNPYASTYGGYFPGDLSNLSRSTSMFNSGGIMWTAGHEMGHLHQSAFNMLGMSEISNNIFSNVVLYELTRSTSRGDGMRTIQDQYARGHHWLEYAIDNENVKSNATGNVTKGRYDNDNMIHIGWWCHTQLYWKLYEYFHLAGRDTRFYQKLFTILRANPLNHASGTAVPASEDYLRFAEACCQASGLNLTDFFEMYGFFRLFSESDYYDNGSHFKTIGGQQCIHIDDYANYYVYVTQAMINTTKTRMAAYGDPVRGIAFIDDRFSSNAKYNPSTARVAFNDEYKFGSEGETSCSVANYTARTKASAHTATFTKYSGGTIGVSVHGSDAAGYVIRDTNGRPLYFSAFRTFTIPANVVTAAGGADALIAAMNGGQFWVATVNGIEIPLGVSEDQATGSGPTDEEKANMLLAMQIRDLYRQVNQDGYVGNYNAADYIDDLEDAIETNNYSALPDLINEIGTLNTFQDGHLYIIRNAGTNAGVNGSYLVGNNNLPQSSAIAGLTRSDSDSRFQWMVHNDGTGKILYNVAAKGTLGSTEASNGHDNWRFDTAPAPLSNAYLTITADAANTHIFSISDPQQIDNTNHYDFLHEKSDARSYGYPNGLTNWTAYSTSSKASGWMFQDAGEASDEVKTELGICLGLIATGDMALAMKIRDLYRQVNQDGYVGNYNAADYIDELETAINNRNEDAVADLLDQIGRTPNTFTDGHLYIVHNTGTDSGVNGSYLVSKNGQPQSSAIASLTYDSGDSQFQWMVYDDGTGSVLYSVAANAALSSTASSNGHDNWRLRTSYDQIADIYVNIAGDEEQTYIFSISDPQQIDNTNHYDFLHEKSDARNYGYPNGLTNWAAYASDNKASGWTVQDVGEASEEVKTALGTYLHLIDTGIDSTPSAEGDTRTYDLSGRAVSKPRKGVYIIRGKVRGI